MQSTKAVAFALEGRLEEAADWAVRGARAPHAHFAIRATAAALCQAAGDAYEARRWRATLLAQKPDFTVGLYFAALPYTDAALRARFREALLALGLPE
jgi:hypothetical protein